MKTSSDRICVYTGIGRMMVHGHERARRVLALPDSGPLFVGRTPALSALGIDLIRYPVDKDGMNGALCATEQQQERSS